MFDAYRQTDRLRGDAAGTLFGFRQLPVRGGGGVACKRFCVADVYQALEKLQRIVKFDACVITALYAKGENTGRGAAHVFLRQMMVGVIFQTCVADPFNLIVIGQMTGNRHGVFAVPLHAQWQSLDTL